MVPPGSLGELVVVVRGAGGVWEEVGGGGRASPTDQGWWGVILVEMDGTKKKDKRGSAQCHPVI